MTKMKNLFDYATKELSQDAFLCWLFESWEDHDLKEVVFGLLRKFGINIRPSSVNYLKAFQQIQHIDITLLIETKREKYAVFIEDKTDSNEHDQLELYDRRILGTKVKRGVFDYPVLRAINERNPGFVTVPDRYEKRTIIDDIMIKRVFYKTSVLDPDSDIPALESSKDLPTTIPAAESVGSEGWIKFDIEDIYSFFKPYAKTKNIILYQYIEHVAKKWEMLTNAERPTGEKDHKYWTAYYRNNLARRLEEKGYLTKVYSWNGKDTALLVKNKLSNKPFFDEDNELPYIRVATTAFMKMNELKEIPINVEIRGREDNAKKIKVRKEAFYILSIDEIDELRTRIQKKNDQDPELYPLEAKDSLKKTLAGCWLPAGTDDDLIESIEKCLNQLSKIPKKYRVIK